ncbi:hypothetical protein [Nonomuraea angiospora]|uniref:hypothetical protein n=1 Tax=Nonomuraea angiospora TaxID=46172 RepID=UPI0029BC6436|nr:hypothetical protein [Nonomuraea angiospora]MDX3110142.1 hypothetical protein [Nonomuraea angiospora]
MDEDEWTVTYFYYGTKRTAEFDSLSGAVGYACRGDEKWQFTTQQIIGPGGVVLTGDALEEAKRRFELPERYGDLDDMPLPGGAAEKEGGNA